MDQIPAWFWMLIIGGLSVVIGMILFYTAMLVRESVMTLREFRFMLVELHDILDSSKLLLEKVNRVADTASSVVDSFSRTVMKPLSVVSSFMDNLTGRFGGDKKI